MHFILFVFVFNFFSLELLKVRSEDAFADKTYTLLSIHIYICILSSLVKIIIEEKVGKVTMPVFILI